MLNQGYSELVKEQGIFSNAPAHSAFNEFIKSLSPEQQDLLSQMLFQERNGTIHDVLAELSWWVDCKGLGLTLNGQPMSIDQSGMGLHGDYVGRLDDWDWPEEDSNNN